MLDRVMEEKCAYTDSYGRTRIFRQQTQLLKWIVLLGLRDKK